MGDGSTRAARDPGPYKFGKRPTLVIPPLGEMEFVSFQAIGYGPGPRAEGRVEVLVVKERPAGDVRRGPGG